MRRGIATFAWAGVVVLAGCFGGGPTPGCPSDATVVFAIPDAGDCSSVGFIGDFALQGDMGVAVVAPNANVCNSNNGGGNFSSEIYTFPADGTAPGTILTSLQAAQGARVAWAGSGLP